MIKFSDIMNNITMFIILCLYIYPCSASGAGDGQSRLEPLYFYLSTYEVAQGHISILNIECKNAQEIRSSLTVRFKERDVSLSLFPDREEEKIIGLVAIPLDTDPGPANVIMNWIQGGEKYCVLIPFTIVTGDFPTTRIHVDPAYTLLSEQDIKRAARESEEVAAIISDTTSERLWQGPWRMPVESTPTGIFGTMRIFNSQVVSVHRGVDLKAETSTPVCAAAGGIVRLTKELFYAGNCVMIDHGMNILTTYAHLSRIQVNNGQTVKAGQIIGLTGSTGRANGPHLHWGVSVGGVRASPLQFHQTVNRLSETE